MDKFDRHTLRREQSIQRLEKAALAVLTRKSYSSIRVEDITGEAGMAKGSLYMYFTGKEELFTCIVRKYLFQEMWVFLDEFLKRRDSKEALRDLVEFCFYEAPANPHLELFYRAVMDKPLLELIRSDIQEFLGRSLATVEGHFRSLGASRPAEQAYILFSLLDGLFIYRFLELAGAPYWRSSVKIKRLKKEVLRLFALD